MKGIVEFRKNVRDDYRETFRKLALEQAPDTLMIACSDSRVVPNLFASADPGDMFVVRNVGNLVAPCGADGFTVGDESEPAAIEFAVENLGVRDIIVCGHSECGAMRAIADGTEKVKLEHLKSWLRQGEPALKLLKEGRVLDGRLAPHNQLSQINVLQQLKHLKTYPDIRKRLDRGTLRLHGWWFNIARADVHSYDADSDSFVLIDEAQAEKILKQLSLP